MQTREPRKRVNWIFVVILIIVIPLTVLTLVMMNSLPPEETKPNEQTIDSAEVGNKDSVDLKFRE